MVNPFGEFDQDLLADAQTELSHYTRLFEKYKDDEELRESLREIIIYLEDSLKDIWRMANEARERYREIKAI
ncbi:MAG: hypothetical protein ACHQYP_05905 [Nitrospiria bacterium]